jgi:hypothetical protein
MKLWPSGKKSLDKEERSAILHLYLSEGREAAERLATSMGLDAWYAYKLANQSGLLPKKGEAA